MYFIDLTTFEKLSNLEQTTKIVIERRNLTFMNKI